MLKLMLSTVLFCCTQAAQLAGLNLSFQQGTYFLPEDRWDRDAVCSMGNLTSLPFLKVPLSHASLL